MMRILETTKMPGGGRQVPQRILRCLLLILSAALKPFVAAEAGGFAILDQGASVAGNAYAGASASALDGTTIFFNPAGLAKLDRPELIASADLIVPDSDYTDDGSTDILGLPRRGTGGAGGSTAVVPALYGVYPLNKILVVGLGINSPFGLKTDYDDRFIGRYEALRSEINTVNINPSVAIRLSRWLSLGAGLSAQHLQATLSNAIDSGALCFGLLGPATCSGLGLVPQSADGRLELKADDWGYGYNLGVLLEPLPGTRIGLSYRSKIDYEAKGNGSFHLPPEAEFLTLGGTVFVNSNIRSDIEVPESANLGFYHQITERLALLAELQWTNWSTIDDLVVEFDNPLQPPAVLQANWQDSFYSAIGLNYRATDWLMLRTGIGYDQTPLRNRTRTPRLPSGDLYSLAGGFSAALGSHLSLDGAYQYIRHKHTEIDLEEPSSGRLKGEFDNQAHVLSLQVTYRF
jgi:long-chain fatty acid transport protein